ncbi:NAD-dependent epimerase [Rhodoplanes sp. SY1]|uniref:NAD-dependent epimerase n=1 Tax=Rhodoplanes sp. SY1 TaxID=3166646 RepID=UPI0038B44977
MLVSRVVLVTGVAGFIGFHLGHRLLRDGWKVVGVDNLNAYYDPTLKHDRLKELSAFADFRFEHVDLADREGVAALFRRERFPAVVHLAAQAGVRHSLKEPFAYLDSNLTGFLTVLEGCRHNDCGHLLYASSSSVYGANTAVPFSTGQNVDHPLSLYGATKKANELMAHSYSQLFGLPTTGLRFFTVYGPWGRPDMAMWLFTEAIATGKPLKLFNHGKMRRDFTYVDDVVESVARLIEHVPDGNAAWSGADPDPASSRAPWRVYNIGNHSPVEVPEVVRLIEEQLRRKARVEYLPMQPGDVPETCADVDDLMAAVDFRPDTSIADGIARFVAWYRERYLV